MNKISFKIENHLFGDAKIDTTKIFIDGIDFIELVKEYEIQLMGDKVSAGDYEGIPPLHLLANLTFKPANQNSISSKANILDCPCGGEGCWPFITAITVNKHYVSWDNFENYHHRKSSRQFWDYSAFGSFKFDKKQYQNALLTLDIRKPLSEKLKKKPFLNPTLKEYPNINWWVNYIGRFHSYFDAPNKTRIELFDDFNLCYEYSGGSIAQVYNNVDIWLSTEIPVRFGVQPPKLYR